MLLRGKGCQCAVMLAEGKTNFVALCGIGSECVCVLGVHGVCVCVVLDMLC